MEKEPGMKVTEIWNDLEVKFIHLSAGNISISLKTLFGILLTLLIKLNKSNKLITYNDLKLFN